MSVSRSPNQTTVAVRTNRYTQRATHTYYNRRQLTDRFRHMNTDTCPFDCQHIHTLRRAHKAPSLSVAALPPTAVKIVSPLLSLKQLIKMLWKRSFQILLMQHFHTETQFICTSILLHDTFQFQDLYIIECNHSTLCLLPLLLCRSNQTPQHIGWTLVLYVLTEVFLDYSILHVCFAAVLLCFATL